MASPARADHNIRRQINLGDSRVQNGHTYIFTGESNQRHESEEQKREDRYRKFIRLLQFPQINARKQNLRPPISDTCAWFVRTPEYTEWVNPLKFDDHHGFLRIRGKPGAGKSTLMKFLLGKSREALPHAEVVSFFFHARGSELERTAMGLYRALLCQLFELFPDLRITLDELDYKEPSFAEYNGWQIQDLQNLIQHAVGKLRSRNIACYIDALDECPEDEIRDLMSFFQSLGREAAKNKTKLNVCFSSRHYPNISFNEGISLVLEDNPKHVLDIKQYVDLKLRIGDSMEYNEIKDKIMHKSSGVFLWVALVIPMLNKAFDRGKVTALRQQLDKLPSELMALFHDILIRDFEQNLEDRDATLLCIQWVLVARDPLDITELYYGIQLGLGNNFLWEHWLSTTMVQMRRFILNSSKGLVQETMHHEGCKPSGTLEFIHESVRDFLLLDKGLLQLWPHLGENVEGKTHDKIKQICLKRIESARSENHATRNHPLLSYAVHHVLDHADIAQYHGIAQLEFLTHFPLDDWVHAYSFVVEKAGPRCEIVEKFGGKCEQYHTIHRIDATLLYILAQHNLFYLVNIHPDRSRHMEIKGGPFHTPLLVALQNRQQETAINLGLLALKNPMAASFIDEEDMAYFKSLREPKSEFEQRPHPSLFTSFAKLDCVGVMKLLFVGGANLNEQDSAGLTALHWAIMSNATRAAKWLISQQPVTPNLVKVVQSCFSQEPTDSSFISKEKTALLVHTSQFIQQFTQQSSLVEKGSPCEIILANMTLDGACSDVSEATSAISAATNYSLDIAHLFISTRRGDSGWRDQQGQNSGSCIVTGTALSGKFVQPEQVTRILRLLPTWRLVTHNHPAISYIIGVSHEMIQAVRIPTDSECLGDPSCDVGLTQFFYTKTSDCVDSIKASLATMDVECDITDSKGRTPLLYAAQFSYPDIVKMLLDTRKVNPDSKDIDGWTPLSEAANFGCIDIVKMLLNTGKVDPDSKDISGWTPLSEAAGLGCIDIVKVLLATREVDPNSKDIRGRTPLLEAAAFGCTDIVKILLDTGKVDPDSKDIYGRTPLSEAAGLGCTDIVKMLLNTGKVNPDSKDIRGRTPLSEAAGLGCIDIVKMLLATREVDPNSKDIRGRTPLSYAAQRHSSNAIQMLLLTEKVDPDSRDNDGMSPLSDAMAWNLPFRMLSDLAGTFRLLWNTGKTDAKARNNAGDTAIDAAHKALERVKHDDTKDIIKSCIKVMESYQTPEEVGYLGDRWWESLNELEDPRMRRSSSNNSTILRRRRRRAMRQLGKASRGGRRSRRRR